MKPAFPDLSGNEEAFLDHLHETYSGFTFLHPPFDREVISVYAPVHGIPVKMAELEHAGAAFTMRDIARKKGDPKRVQAVTLDCAMEWLRAKAKRANCEKRPNSAVFWR